MKTKLLRKIRKRYSIIRVDDLGSDASDERMWTRYKYGMPFYEIRYRNSLIARCSTFNGARDILLEWVIKKYTLKLRAKPEVSKKVW
jgi:hypothetical protein